MMRGTQMLPYSVKCHRPETQLFESSPRRPLIKIGDIHPPIQTVGVFSQARCTGSIPTDYCRGRSGVVPLGIEPVRQGRLVNVVKLVKIHH